VDRNSSSRASCDSSAIVDQGWKTAEDLAAWRREAEQEVNTAADRVRREPSPDPEEDDWAALSRPEYREQFASA
jgi:TPP-dependent pyruvate/acetoin dehydrogenase alpha subunit